MRHQSAPRQAAIRWICALALLAMAPLAYAPPPVPRLALVIGNAKYPDQHLGTLKTARNDAEDVAKGFDLLGYQVSALFDGDLGGLHQALDSFANKLRSDRFHDAVAVVYFAGYGLQQGGRNFLLPVNFETRNGTQNLDQTAIALDRDILLPLAGRGGGANVIVLDACRDDPFGQRQGLAQVDHVPNGTLVELAAEPNAQSIENVDPKAPERNGIFAKHMLKKLERPNPDLDIRQFFDMVGNTVYEASNKAQKPRIMTAQTPPALPDRLSLFNENTPALASGPELQSWRRVEKSTHACAFEQHLKRFPDGAFADSARAALQAIQAKIEAAPQAFSNLPQDLKIQVTRSFQAKQAAEAAECARLWAFEGFRSNTRRRETDRAALQRLTLKLPLLARPHPNPLPQGKGALMTASMKNLVRLAEEDPEVSPANRPAPQAVGDPEFQADLLQAGQGEINAMFRVALVYEAGSHGVEQNETEMMHWLALSSSLGNGLASYKLYRYFAGQASGYAKAVKYKSLASKQGYYGPVALEAER